MKIIKDFFKGCIIAIACYGLILITKYIIINISLWLIYIGIPMDVANAIVIAGIVFAGIRFVGRSIKNGGRKK